MGESVCGMSMAFGGWIQVRIYGSETFLVLQAAIAV